MTPTAYLEKPKTGKVVHPPRPKSPVVRPKKMVTRTPKRFLGNA